MAPIISIIVPIYNGAEYLDATIQSVLAQTFTNWELILVDDGSTDNSVEIATKYVDGSRVILLQHPDKENRGVSKSRKLGISFSKGTYIAFLDADDIFESQKLEIQLSIFESNPSVVLVHSRIKPLNETSFDFPHEFGFADKDTIYELQKSDHFLEYNFICNSTVLVKAEVFKKLPFAFPQAFQYEDWLAWCLLAQHGTFYYSNQALVTYRIHNNSATAAIFKNQLIQYYSKIELLSCLYLAVPDKDQKTIILEKVKEALVILLTVYSEKTGAEEEKTRKEFFLALSDNNPGIAYYKKKSEEEETRYMELQHQYNSIMRSSFFQLIKTKVKYKIKKMLYADSKGKVS